MGIEAPARVKYALIREATERDGNMLNVSWMCRIAGVTRSGYYAWLDAAPARQSREEADQIDFEHPGSLPFPGPSQGRTRHSHEAAAYRNPHEPKENSPVNGKIWAKMSRSERKPVQTDGKAATNQQCSPQPGAAQFPWFRPQENPPDGHHLSVLQRWEMLLVNHSGCHDQRDSGLPAEPLSGGVLRVGNGGCSGTGLRLSLIHISEPTRPY